MAKISQCETQKRARAKVENTFSLILRSWDCGAHRVSHLELNRVDTKTRDPFSGPWGDGRVQHPTFPHPRGQTSPRSGIFVPALRAHKSSSRVARKHDEYLGWLLLEKTRGGRRGILK